MGMGRYLLRREVLKKILLLFAFCLNIAAWAQSVDRPLRSVQPDALPITLSTPPATPSALLTPSAVNRALTQHYIAQYSTPGGIVWLKTVMERGSLYLPFIREEISKRNLPPELIYLPVIESGSQSTARSRSGAVGLWQFMMNSIAPFGIKVNEFVDERRDFQKATRGALQKLEENYRALGDWPLALAAYNAGLGGVSQAIRRTAIRDYWELCEKKELKNETIHYVPRLLAAAYILSQPRRYGADLWPEALEWTSIPLDRQVSLDILDSETGVDRELLRRLNAELLLGISPPDRNYLLKVPLAQLPLFSQVLERKDLLLRYYYYAVQYGDTLSALSRHYGVSLGLIEQHNPGILNRYLKIGETVVIPAYQERQPYSPVRPSVASSLGTLTFEGSHLVKKGETLWSLALAYDVDPQVLAEANNMELNQILNEGKTLKVPIMN
jgi:membrane-bound lytic murein transglycosylase D